MTCTLQKVVLSTHKPKFEVGKNEQKVLFFDKIRNFSRNLLIFEYLLQDPIQRKYKYQTRCRNSFRTSNFLVTLVVLPSEISVTFCTPSKVQKNNFICHHDHYFQFAGFHDTVEISDGNKNYKSEK